MADKLTDAALIQVLQVAKDNGAAGAAKLYGIGVRQMHQRIATAKARGLSATTPVVDEKAKLRAKVKELEAANRRMEHAAHTHDSLREAIYGLAATPPDAPAWCVDAPKKSVRTPGIPMTIWSDWHWGEVVNAAEVGGVNEYSFDVATARIKRLVNTTISLAKDHMVRPSYPGIVIALGGDMITGAIHEELKVTNWGTTQQQFLEVQDMLAAALSTMADSFGRVFVPCVVGNHGRDTIKPQFKGRVYTSYEWNLYNQLERLFKKDRRFRFMIPEETDAYFKCYGHRFLLTHGDTLGVKGGDGIIGAIGPIARGATKVGRAEAQIGRDFDTLIMGHWHTYIPRGDATPVIVNGSPKGYDEYARLALRVPYSRPSQALWFVHQDHGITAQWQVFLDDRRKASDNSQWLTWQEAA